MRDIKDSAWLAIGVLMSSILIISAWGGYKAVGFELLLAQLPLCG